MKQTGWRVLGAHVYLPEMEGSGGEWWWMQLTHLKKGIIWKKTWLNFLSSVCVRIKLVAVVLEQKHHQQQKSLMQISKNCKPEPENHVLKHHYEFVTLLWIEDKRENQITLLKYIEVQGITCHAFWETLWSLWLPHLFILASSQYPPSCLAIWGPVQVSHWRINSHSNEIPLPLGGRMTSVK